MNCDRPKTWFSSSRTRNSSVLTLADRAFSMAVTWSSRLGRPPADGFAAPCTWSTSALSTTRRSARIPPATIVGRLSALMDVLPSRPEKEWAGIICSLCPTCQTPTCSRWRSDSELQNGYGLSAQNRKKSGRVSPSFGLLRQRTRGEAPARGCCCGGGDQEAQAVRASSARTRRARVTAGYHTPADATRLRPSFISRRRRAAPSRYEGARPARLWRAGHAARRDLRAGRAAAGPDAARRHPAGRRRLRAAGARGAARGHLAHVVAAGRHAAARPRGVRARALLRPRHRVRARRPLGARLRARAHGAPRRGGLSLARRVRRRVATGRAHRAAGDCAGESPHAPHARQRLAAPEPGRC